MDCIYAACWTMGQVGDGVENKQANVFYLMFQEIKIQVNYQHAYPHIALLDLVSCGQSDHKHTRENADAKPYLF